jgi:hypothetical protein
LSAESVAEALCHLADIDGNMEMAPRVTSASLDRKGNFS